MLDLKNLGVKSIIMTSGTLSPMDAFKEDMKIPFPIELENPHVIQKNQVNIFFLTHIHLYYYLFVIFISFFQC